MWIVDGNYKHAFLSPSVIVWEMQLSAKMVERTNLIQGVVSVAQVHANIPKV